MRFNLLFLNIGIIIHFLGGYHKVSEELTLHKLFTRFLAFFLFYNGDLCYFCFPAIVYFFWSKDCEVFFFSFSTACELPGMYLLKKTEEVMSSDLIAATKEHSQSDNGLWTDNFNVLSRTLEAWTWRIPHQYPFFFRYVVRITWNNVCKMLISVSGVPQALNKWICFSLSHEKAQCPSPHWCFYFYFSMWHKSQSLSLKQTLSQFPKETL